VRLATLEWPAQEIDRFSCAGKRGSVPACELCLSLGTMRYIVQA